MCRSLKIFLVGLATSLLLLHSFLPHHHNSGPDVRTGVQSNLKTRSLFGLISVVILQDAGEGHCENYHHGKIVLKDLNPEQSPNLILFVANRIDVGAQECTPDCEQYVPPYLPGYKNISFISSRLLRAPPMA